MNNLNIIQSKSSTELVTSIVIEKLYQLALTSKVADPSSSFTMNLQGNISAPAAYEDSVEYLLQKFLEDLIINIPVGKFYLRFKDPVIEQWCITHCGDGVGVTQADAAGIIKDSDFWGHGNVMTTEEKDLITSLDDFKYFTGTPSTSSAVMRSITNATEITFPSVTFTYNGLYSYTVIESTRKLSNINYANVSFVCNPQINENNGSIGHIKVIDGNDTIVDWSSDLIPNQTDFYHVRLFHAWTKLLKIIFPEGITRTYEQFFGCKSLQYIEFPSTITDLGSWVGLSLDGSNSYVIVIKATTPPECTYLPNNNDNNQAGWGWHKFPTAIYVPDSAVNTYKNVSAWTISSAKYARQLVWVDLLIKDRIRPLSELPTSYRLMGTVTQEDIDRV